ncbi:MAG: methyltransferase domain-containing protein [Thermoleophilia bacterium]|nr:methyltransferase domain-containing protein [Thermoleophilia bacterium]
MGKAISRLVARAPWAWPVISRPVKSFFDSRAKGWDSNTGAGSAEHLAPLAAGVLRAGKDPERVLDIGCGTGAATFFLAREYPRARIRGVDLSPVMIDQANSRIGLDPEARVAFRVGDAGKLPYPDEHFDLVTQTNMPVFFAEIDRVLRSGGSVVIASSSGQNTPFSTPDDLLGKKFGKLGFSGVETGTAARGTYFAARKKGLPE